MQITADLQLHSRFARAVSKDMNLPYIAAWAKRKGIGVVATGDWTHPLWMREIKANLEELGNGLLKLRTQNAELPAELDLASRDNDQANPLFLLATEVSSIYSQGGKGRRVHTLVWVPTLAAADKINQAMTKRGCNLLSDGRPIIPLTSIEVADLVLNLEPKALIIPAHAWTPWFSVYGAMSGFDTLTEAFGPFAKNVYAVETGLSSSPAMNWRIKELDQRSIVSFSDAHSGPKLGREATVFEIPDGNLHYDAIYEAIKGTGALGGSPFGSPRQGPTTSSPLPPGAKAVTRLEKTRLPAPSITYTIEFYPEEGKYHYTGHRLCNVRLGPEETRTKGVTCPVCGKPLTQGVMQRVEELAGRSEADLKLEVVSRALVPDGPKVQMTASGAFPQRPPYVMLVPLVEIIAEAVGSPVTSPRVQTPYQRLTAELGGEFTVLLQAETTDIAKVAGEPIAAGVGKVRRGDIVIDPGYDGVFGVVKIWRENEAKPLLDSSKEQLSIF